MPTSDAASQLLHTALTRDEQGLLSEWRRGLQQETGARAQELLGQTDDFLRAVRAGFAEDAHGNVHGEAWAPARELVVRISRQRATAGYTPIETATFLFSLKRPLFERLRGAAGGGEPGVLLDALWRVTQVLDGLGLLSTEAFQKAREDVIKRQQEEMLELSTPVITLWDGVLALPLIGTLDSHRTQVVMETLLQRIVETEAEVAIIDITGVPTVDTMVAQHLIKTVTATRLMGADCIISGIRPQIAQTIVHLGVDLGDVVTKSTLAGAFQLALQRTGKALRAGGAPPSTRGTAHALAVPARGKGAL